MELSNADIATVDISRADISNPDVSSVDISSVGVSDIVVCSFYTADDYYRSHAAGLRENLLRIGEVGIQIEEITKAASEDWADICRRKIGFLARVCEENPTKKVFWIDVDCGLTDLPSYVTDFTADIIGFQRGFGSPLRIGYANRTRFWEPCFFGINTTPAARKFIRDAGTLEQSATIKATDDYFFEESWRANASNLSFQLIPSLAVTSRATELGTDVPAFFSFGKSGNVKTFRDQVVQHGRIETPSTRLPAHRLRQQLLRGAKLVERTLPDRNARLLRKAADKYGLTHLLTNPSQSISPALSPHRSRIVKEMLMAGQRGDRTQVDVAFGRLNATRVPTATEIAAKQAADTFAEYAGKPGTEPIRLSWWPRPFPGNFGDWLSPMIIAANVDQPVVYQSPTARSQDRHLVSVGSIGRFIKPSSIVVGTGISNDDIVLESGASYVSVRGPITAQVLRESGGPLVESMGDPGALISRIIPVERGLTNGRLALVRHFSHRNIPVSLPENVDELSVLCSHPTAIRSFVTELNQYDAVVTSAMHVMITCHSYGIPCALITFDGFESSVHGSGIKYKDYCLGAGLGVIYEPVPVQSDLRRVNLESMLAKEEITAAKLDEIEAAVATGISTYLNAGA